MYICAMDELKIYDSIPLPKRKYPFDELKVGQCFMVEKRPDESKKNLLYRLNSSGRYWGNKLGVKFTCRSISESEIIVWRVK